MIVTPVELDIAALGLGNSGGVRGEGLHASDIYSDLYQDLEPKRFVRDRPFDLPTLETGIIWENILEEGLRRRFGHLRPGEFQTPEGIYFNPDLFMYEGPNKATLRVGEIKATWMSAKDGIQHAKFDKYLTQLKFYCEALGTDLGCLLVFFVNGDMTIRPYKPLFRAWNLQFTPTELKENYAMLIKHAESKGML